MLFINYYRLGKTQNIFYELLLGRFCGFRGLYYERRHEQTGLLLTFLRPGNTQTGPLSYRD